MASMIGDPAREPKPFVNPYKNLDLPPVAFGLGKPYVDGVTNVARPGFNTTGREVELQVNAYPITKFPTQNIFQYDVTIVKVGKEHEAPAPRARKLVWDSPARKNKYKQIIFDGAKLAWSSISYDDPHGILVDLAALPGGNGNGNGTPGYRLIVRKSKSINLQVLEQWLLKKGPFDERVLEALNFLDHLLREWPSTKFTPIKRAFYDQNEPGQNFDNSIDIRKGFYQAIRPAMGGRLVVNVDSVLCTFWRQVTLVSLADSFLEKFDWNRTAQAMKAKHFDPQNPFRGYKVSEAHKHVWSKLRHLEVKPVFEGCRVNRTYHIRAILMEDAHSKTFTWTDPATNKERKISINDYFKQKYNLTLFCPQLPVVEMTTKDIYYPMECLQVAGLQRYNHKLTERQTTDMLRLAVRKPQLRFGDIVKAKAKLDHAQDPILKHFGMQISPNMLVTKGRLLPAPEIQFGGNAKINPQTQGRWDLRGKKFLEANKAPLKSWGVGIIKQGRSLSVAQAEEWTQGFMKQYAGHGGKVTSRPTILELTGDTAEAVYRLFMATGNNAKQRPQLLLFIAPNKDAMVYNRIKKSCDCRFGVASQVVQKAHVEKKNPQYMSNVAMKINAKLGGVTCKAVPRQSDAMHRPGSIIIGADVSHAAPGSVAPSLTAISVSADQNAAKYMGSCQTGDSRVEIINEQNMKEMLTPLVDEWTKTVGNGRRPQNIYYFRDGVSTGQFAQVLEKEVPVIKDVIFNGSGDKTPPKITVVIGNKRHHIRGAPRPTDKTAGDKNGNALPGTLIERDVTSPHDWDFLLIAHVALQGTAQPVHYHVIRDEMNHQPAQLQNMIYNHCYQYVRSTTSVSLFPAIYYAHLISNRARCQSADEFIEGSDESPESSDPNQRPKPLLAMAKNENRNNLEMWFV